MKTCDQVRTRAATFYARNHRAWLAGDFSPLTVNLLPPTGRAAELDEGRAVQAWIQEWKRSRITAEWEEKKLGYLGTYALPARVVLDSPATAARVAGRAEHWLRINTLLDGFAASLGADVRSPLISKLAAWESWDDATVARFVSVVRWLRTHDPSAYYIRELPIFGVDSKWVEAHRAVLTAVVGELTFRDKPVLVELRGAALVVPSFRAEGTARGPRVVRGKPPDVPCAAGAAGHRRDLRWRPARASAGEAAALACFKRGVVLGRLRLLRLLHP